MESHIKSARAHRALSWLYAVIAAFFLFLLVRLISQGASAFFWMPSLVMLVVLFGLAALHHFTAKGARDLKPWANVASKAVAILMLFVFPLGTLIGIYLLVNSDWRAPLKNGSSLADAWPVQPKTASDS